MALSEEALKHIEDVSQRLIEGAKSLHLGSIAKSIEQEEGCQIFIVPLDDKGSDVKSTGWMATCESYIGIGGDTGKRSLKESKIMRICHHFIFYKPCPEDIEVERLRVARGLAHCALHWPLGPRKNRLVRVNLHGVDAYVVRFLEQEEKEADALARLLAAFRPAV